MELVNLGLKHYPDNIEKKWKGDKLGKNFKKCYEEINARIKQRDSFNKDF